MHSDPLPKCEYVFIIILILKKRASFLCATRLINRLAILFQNKKKKVLSMIFRCQKLLSGADNFVADANGDCRWLIHGGEVCDERVDERDY